MRNKCSCLRLESSDSLEAPAGLSMAIRRPSDVIRLTEEPITFVSFWSWAESMPNKLWFSLNPDEPIVPGLVLPPT
eukprot:459412-Amphidinium_carterae.1